MYFKQQNHLVFANAYILLKDETLLDEARHGYEFLRDHCIDKENGGIFWYDL